MSMTEKKAQPVSPEIQEKRWNVVKEVASGVVKFCVGAFFGATAAFITKDSQAPKIERYSIIAGGTLVGLYVGGQASDQMCLRIDSIADRMTRAQNAEEEDK